jgi:integrase
MIGIPSLLSYFDDVFLKHHFRGRSHDVRRNYRLAIKTLGRYLEREPQVIDLTPETLAGFTEWMLANKLARYTRRTTLQRLRTIWRAANADGFLPDKPPMPWWIGTGLAPNRGTSAEAKPKIVKPMDILMPEALPLGVKPATPGEYIPHYALERGITRKAAMMIRYRLTHFEKHLGRVAEWSDFNDMTVNIYLATVLAAGSAPQTVRGGRNALLALWRAAFQAEIIDHEPKRVRKIKCPAKRPECWTLDELRTLLATCRKVRGAMKRDRKVRRWQFWRAYVLVGYHSGLRLGDLLALRWSNIASKGLLSVTMSKTGDRLECQLPDEALEALKPLRSNQRQLVFGDLISRGSFLEMFARIRFNAGLSGSSKWLRRSGASHVEAIRPGAATAFLGHRTPDLAVRNYIDPRISRQERPMPPSIEGGDA